MKSSFCIDLQRFMLIPTKFPLSQKHHSKAFFYNGCVSRGLQWLYDQGFFNIGCVSKDF